MYTLFLRDIYNENFCRIVDSFDSKDQLEMWHEVLSCVIEDLKTNSGLYLCMAEGIKTADEFLNNERKELLEANKLRLI